MTSSPKVSIVIPAYQAEKTIERAIKSVLKQTFADLEVLVVDNASLDETKQKVLELSQQDPRVIYIYSDKNLGPAGGRNIGIDQAKGELIAFLDADDEWKLDSKLTEQVSILDMHSSIGLVFTDCETFDEVTKQGRLYSSFNNLHTRNIQLLPVEHFHNWFLLNGNLAQSLYSGNFICISTVVVRKAILEEVQAFTSLLFGTEDIDLWVRLAPTNLFCYWNKPTTRYFWLETSISRIDEKRIKELIKYHLYCREAPAYGSMQELVLSNLEYCYKLEILEYSRQWRTLKAFQSYWDAQKHEVRSLRLLLYALSSCFGPIPLFIKLNLINRATLKSA